MLIGRQQAQLQYSGAAQAAGNGPGAFTAARAAAVEGAQPSSGQEPAYRVELSPGFLRGLPGTQPPQENPALAKLPGFQRGEETQVNPLERLPGFENAAQAQSNPLEKLPGFQEANGSFRKQDESSALPVEEESCDACENRKYVDGSSDGAVSFQTPASIKGAGVAGVVAAHEREHVFREEAKARMEGREVLRQSVRIKYDICPVCGKPHVAGGETVTVTAKKAEQAYTTMRGMPASPS